MNANKNNEVSYYIRGYRNKIISINDLSIILCYCPSSYSSLCSDKLSTISL